MIENAQENCYQNYRLLNYVQCACNILPYVACDRWIFWLAVYRSNHSGHEHGTHSCKSTITWCGQNGPTLIPLLTMSMKMVSLYVEQSASMAKVVRPVNSNLSRKQISFIHLHIVMDDWFLRPEQINWNSNKHNNNNNLVQQLNHTATTRVCVCIVYYRKIMFIYIFISFFSLYLYEALSWKYG